MKGRVFFLIVAGLLWPGWYFINQQALAQDKGPVVRAYADLLKPIPQQDFLKLRGNKKDETAMAMSKTLVTNESKKPNTFKLKVTKVETNMFPDQGVTGWLITSDCEEKVKIGSMNIPVFLRVYIAQDPSGMMPKLKRGETVVATGELTEIAMNITPQGPMLYMVLWLASVTTVAK